MDEGKKVRRTAWNDSEYYWFKSNNKIKDTTANVSDISIFDCVDELSKGDWELVDDDKDWNLAENPYSDYKQMVKFELHDVVKCRDLILRDFKKVFLSIDDESSREEFENIVLKRFGDLK